MSEVAVEREVVAGPIASPRELAPYAVFAGALLTLVVFFVGTEQATAALGGGAAVHELLHDARHLLSFPCH